LVVDLGDGPLAVRAEPAAGAGTVRWLLAQAVAIHPTRELCVVSALAPAPDESWLWLNWLPHARPGVAPLAGPHVATTPEATLDLWQRLAVIVSDRNAGGATGARILAVLDGRLGARPVDLADTARVGVHAVLVLPPGAPTPFGMSTLDIAADGMRCRLVRAGSPPVDGEAESVTAGYVRELADLLPDA
jgi:S-DNA-T family DNA segregation ATPase FtsK/SpoIIIE